AAGATTGAAATAAASATTTAAAGGAGAGHPLGGEVGLEPLPRLLGPALLLLGDQLAELGLGLGAALGVLGGALVGLLLLLGDQLGERLDLGALGLERRPLLGELADQLVEVVGGARADAQGDAAVL